MTAPDSSHRPHSYVAGFLSYVVPGLGQIVLGAFEKNGNRIAKGVMFMVILLGMFHLGEAMGSWKNVYLPTLAKDGNNVPPWDNNPWHLPKPFLPIANVYHRWHFAGQFWVGAAAWPALWQYYGKPMPSKDDYPFWHNYQKEPSEWEINAYLTNQDKTPDLAWVYTVIAGILNILVIYDAFAGPAYGSGRPASKVSEAREPAATEPKPTEIILK